MPKPRKRSVRNMLADASKTAECREARVAWSKATAKAWYEAHKRMDAAWDRIFEALPDDLTDEEIEAIPPPPEEAEVEALYARLRAAIDEDKWPRECYVGGM